jgi:hypothetical protein
MPDGPRRIGLGWWDELTEMGRAFGVYVDTSKKKGDGSPVRQIKWRASVVEFLNQRYPVGEDAEQ